MEHGERGARPVGQPGARPVGRAAQPPSRPAAQPIVAADPVGRCRPTRIERRFARVEGQYPRVEGQYAPPMDALALAGSYARSAMMTSSGMLSPA